MIGGKTKAFLQVSVTVKNEIGERVATWYDAVEFTGWLDLQSGDSNYSTYNAKIQESMTIGYDQASIDNQIKVLEKNIKDYEQLIINEPEDKDYWQEMIDKCKADIEDLKSYAPLQESSYDDDENYKLVSIAFDVEAPSNMKESDIENVIRRAIDGTDLFVSSYMEVHTLSESLKTRSTYRCDENFSLKDVKKG